MKKTFLAFAAMTASLSAMAWQGNVLVQTPHTQMLLHAQEGGELVMDYYGARLADATEVMKAAQGLACSALPAFGTADMVQLPALQMQHADGDQQLELQVTAVETQTADRYTLTTVTMQDRLKPVTVRLFYKAYTQVDIIETWTEISHQQKKAVRLTRYDSGHIAVPRGDVWVTHLHGDWAAETTPTQEPLLQGVKVIRNTDGTRNAHLDAPELMLSLDGRPQENQGRTIGVALCWSGNFELRLNTRTNQPHELYAGIDPQSSTYTLEPKEVFQTPHLALTFSNEGLSGASRNFHRWARHEGMLHDGNALRSILLNSWEGVYFDIDEQRMHQMMADIAALGGELFVMDDGWFGAKYPRKNDSSSLGDWVVDTHKLPHGLKGLTDEAQRLGIRFGIWIEPECTNTASELFEQHPDWALQGVKGRQLKQGRGGTQLVLDMTNPKVQDFVFNLVDTLLTNYPGISYIKWDMNASIQNYGSTYLPRDKQQHLYIDYHRGLLKTLQRIRAKYPDVTIQDCASGGGRANYGLLPYFDEFWVSDNTDALQRVYMQYGTSFFFPANAMAAHINHCPYWNTGLRTIPIKFRNDVAMSGRLGIELQPKNMTDDEREQTKRCMADYKRIRPLVQQGELYRLLSPYERKGVASLMYTDEAHTEAVLFVYKTENMYGQLIPRIQLAGLDPAARYQLTELNVKTGEKPCDLDGATFSGQMLCQTGLAIPLWREYCSRVFLLKRM